MVSRLLRIAVVYLMLGATMGVVMGITRQVQYAPVHAHINLLGWVSLALIGVIYHLYPSAALTRLAQWHFWLHNIGLPVFMVSLLMLLSGQTAAVAGVAAGAITTLTGLALFAINLVRNVRSMPRSAAERRGQ